MITRALVPTFIALAAAAPTPATAADATASLLDRCLDDPANASTAGQTACERRAAQTYDRRLNAAYQALLKTLPPLAAQRLKEAQRAWAGFRSADARARAALYGSRQGTIFVPMQADSETRILRDRTLQLESYLGAMKVGE
jgi:uncharacterized protein YecT (DUF1311 family)